MKSTALALFLLASARADMTVVSGGLRNPIPEVSIRGDSLVLHTATVHSGGVKNVNNELTGCSFTTLSSEEFATSDHIYLNTTTNKTRLDRTNSILVTVSSNYVDTIDCHEDITYKIVPKFRVRNLPLDSILIDGAEVTGSVFKHTGTKTMVISVTSNGTSFTNTISANHGILSNYVSTTYSFQSTTFPEGSLGKHLQDQIISRVASNGYDSTVFDCVGYDGVTKTGWRQAVGSPTLIDDSTGWTTPSDMYWKTYHTWGYGYSRSLKRNPNNVFKDVDLSCVAIMNNASGKNQEAGTLITRKHFILANHFSTQQGFNVGTKVIFMGMLSQVYTGVVAKTENLGSDIQLYELSEEVPDYINPCKVPPTNWPDYFSGLGSNLHNPSLFFIDQRKHVVISEMWYLPYALACPSGNLFSALGIMWDSGCPIMALVSGEPVVLSVFHAIAGGLIGVYDMVSDIESQISLWGSTNRVQIVDLSEFIK